MEFQWRSQLPIVSVFAARTLHASRALIKYSKLTNVNCVISLLCPLSSRSRAEMLFRKVTPFRGLSAETTIFIPLARSCIAIECDENVQNLVDFVLKSIFSVRVLAFRLIHLFLITSTYYCFVRSLFAESWLIASISSFIIYESVMLLECYCRIRITCEIVNGSGNRFERNRTTEWQREAEEFYLHFYLFFVIPFRLAKVPNRLRDLRCVR